MFVCVRERGKKRETDIEMGSQGGNDDNDGENVCDREDFMSLIREMTSSGSDRRSDRDWTQMINPDSLRYIDSTAENDNVTNRQLEFMLNGLVASHYFPGFLNYLLSKRGSSES